MATPMEQRAGRPVPLSSARGGDAAMPCRSPLAPFAECPLCGGGLAPEHAHFRCRRCGWRDSCCD